MNDRRNEYWQEGVTIFENDLLGGSFKNTRLSHKNNLPVDGLKL